MLARLWRWLWSKAEADVDLDAETRRIRKQIADALERALDEQWQVKARTAALKAWWLGTYPMHRDHRVEVRRNEADTGWLAECSCGDVMAVGDGELEN